MPPKIATQYIAPTSRAFGRMTTILFRPFDLGKWFVLGFSAWLATLLDGGGSSSNLDFSGFGPEPQVETDGNNDFDTLEGFKEWVLSSWTELLAFLEENPWVVPTAIACR